MNDLKQITATSTVKQIQLLKSGIWAYFLLLIFEGAIRKWIFPGLATPLLCVMRSGPAVLSVVITGVPCDMTSVMTNPNPSKRDGNTKMSCSRINSKIW